MVWCPEQLLQRVLAHIHYMPDHWQGNASKSETRNEMAQLFQYKAVSAGQRPRQGGGPFLPPDAPSAHPHRSSSWRSC